MTRDRVTPELAAAVFARDGGCLASQLGGSAMDCWGRLRIEHVKATPRMGKRAEPQLDRLGTLCEGHTRAAIESGLTETEGWLLEVIDDLEAEAEGLLDAAFAAADAAVTAWGGTLMLGHTDECRFCSGWWATASKREPETRYPVIVSSENGRPRGEHHDGTPAAALDALRAALAASQDGGTRNG